MIFLKKNAQAAGWGLLLLSLLGCATKVAPPPKSPVMPPKPPVVTQPTVFPAATPSPVRTPERVPTATISTPVAIVSFPDARAYRETGVAGSYPISAQGQITASGIPHDAQSLTAAHATLPLFSKVWVQHGQRRKLVTITDRLSGDNVLIRVSYQVARDLGIDATRGSVVSLQGIAP
jgi:rare lipoprotein A